MRLLMCSAGSMDFSRTPLRWRCGEEKVTESHCRSPRGLSLGARGMAMKKFMYTKAWRISLEDERAKNNDDNSVKTSWLSEGRIIEYTVACLQKKSSYQWETIDHSKVMEVASVTTGLLARASVNSWRHCPSLQSVTLRRKPTPVGIASYQTWKLNL